MSRPSRWRNNRTGFARYAPGIAMAPVLWVAMSADASPDERVTTGVAIAVAISAVSLIDWALRRRRHDHPHASQAATGSS